MPWHQQHVIECECLFKNPHTIRVPGSSERRRIVPLQVRRGKTAVS